MDFIHNYSFSIDDKLTFNALVDVLVTMFEHSYLKKKPDVNSDSLMQVVVRDQDDKIIKKIAIDNNLDFAVADYLAFKKFIKENLLKKRNYLTKEMYKQNYDKKKICNILDVFDDEFETIVK